MLREAGAAEVHVRISSPPVRWPCFYGIDFATRAELIATGLGVEEVCNSIGADSLGYISEAGMIEATNQPHRPALHGVLHRQLPDRRCPRTVGVGKGVLELELPIAAAAAGRATGERHPHAAATRGRRAPHGPAARRRGGLDLGRRRCGRGPAAPLTPPASDAPRTQKLGGHAATSACPPSYCVAGPGVRCSSSTAGRPRRGWGCPTTVNAGSRRRSRRRCRAPSSAMNRIQVSVGRVSIR